MLTFLPLLLLLLIVILVQIIARSKLNIGNQWLILVLAVVFVWGVMIFLRSHLPAPVVIANWFPAESDIGSLVFILDEKSWSFVFALISLLTGMVLVDTINLHEQTDIRNWSRAILLFVLGIFCSILNSLLAFILAWTVFDIIELVVQLGNRQDNKFPRGMSAVLFMHFLGTLLILAVLILNRNQGDPFNLAGFQASEFAILILGASLRMTFYHEEEKGWMNRGLKGQLDFLRQLLSPFLAMVFLSRLPQPDSVNGILVLFLLLAICFAVLAATKWIFAVEAVEKIQSWIILFCSFAVISAIRGQAESVVAWATLMVFVGGWIWLFLLRFQHLDFILAVVCLALLGFPYTPSAAAFSGITTGPISALNFLLWICAAFLIIGVIRSATQKIEERGKIEPWMNLFYFVGIGVVVVSPWIIIRNPGTDMAFTKIFAPLFVTILAAIFAIFTYVKSARTWLIARLPDGTGQSVNKAMTISRGTFQGGRLLLFADTVYAMLKRLINGFNRILEGEGGILWAFVFLALLVSLFAGSIGK
jgi:hypothetical protein